MLEQVVAARVARNLPRPATVHVVLMDYGARLGVAINTWASGGKQIGRHAVVVQIERDDLTKAADNAAAALADWLGDAVPAVATTMDKAFWAGKMLARCMGGRHCSHGQHQCTADADYQRFMAQSA